MEVKSNKGGQLTKEFVKCWNDSPISDKINIHNIFTSEMEYVYDILPNNEHSIRTLALSDELMTILLRTSHGKYNVDDAYVWCDDDGMIISGTRFDELPFFSVSKMVKYFISGVDRLMLLNDVESMTSFVSNSIKE